MHLKFISSILGAKWLIEPNWLKQNQHLVNQLLKGELAIDNAFGTVTKENSLSIVNAEGVKSKSSEIAPDSIAIVTIHGAITKYDGWCNYGALSIAQTLDFLYSVDNVKGIVLDIDSPGGEGGGATVLAEAINRRNKPVVAHITNGIAASAAYWAASQCDEIYVSRKEDQVGSIGSYISFADYTEAWTKEGIKIITVYAPQSEDKNKAFRELIENDNEELMKADLKEYTDCFIEDVRNGRSKTINGEEWATGKMYYPKDAKKLGLIDGVMDRKKVLGRIDKLRNQIFNNKMSENNYPQIAATAGWNDYATDETGLHLSHEDADKVEAVLANISTANAEKTNAETSLEAMKQSLTTAEADLATANDTIATLNAKVSEQEAKIAELNQTPANDGTSLENESDSPEPETAETNTHPFTQEAMKMFSDFKAAGI